MADSHEFASLGLKNVIESNRKISLLCGCSFAAIKPYHQHHFGSRQQLQNSAICAIAGASAS